MSLIRKAQQCGVFARIWHIYDATWQDPFESAKLIARHLKGLNKPIYHPLNDCGDHVVVINSKEIAMKGTEWQKRVYFHHNTYHGGATYTFAWELHQKDPTLVMEKAVYSSMKGNLQRRHLMQRLHIFPDENIPKDIACNISNQIRQLRPVPVRLDRIPAEEVEAFPKLVQYPVDYQWK